MINYNRILLTVVITPVASPLLPQLGLQQIVPSKRQCAVNVVGM